MVSHQRLARRKIQMIDQKNYTENQNPKTRDHRKFEPKKMVSNPDAMSEQSLNKKDCDSQTTCIGKAQNFHMQRHPLYYMPWGVTWYEAGALGPNAYGLTIYADGKALLSQNGFTVDADAVLQILLPDLKYTASFGPIKGDIWGLSGYSSNNNQNIANSIYVVRNSEVPGRWVLQRFNVNFYQVHAYIQFNHMIGPYEINVPRVVELVNIVCPNNTWEWTGTAIGSFNMVRTIYVRSRLRKPRCKCTSRKCVQTQVCKRRRVTMDHIKQPKV